MTLLALWGGALRYLELSEAMGYGINMEDLGSRRSTAPDPQGASAEIRSRPSTTEQIRQRSKSWSPNTELPKPESPNLNWRSKSSSARDNSQRKQTEELINELI